MIEVVLVDPVLRPSKDRPPYYLPIGEFDEMFFENIRANDLGGDWHPVQGNEREVYWKQVLRDGENRIIAWEDAVGWKWTYGGPTYRRLFMRIKLAS